MRVLRGITAALLFLGLCAGPASGQTLTGSIFGAVKDELGAVMPGVTVTVTGKEGSRSQITDSDGLYRFPALDVGTHQLTAELSGFSKATRTNLQIGPNRELSIDLQMILEGVSETIVVTGKSPVVDVRSSATDNTVSQALLYSAPISRLNAATELLNYFPGIDSQSAYGADSATGNALLIDGIDSRDPSRGSFWTFYNYNIVEEVQAQGLGAPAEFGGFTGAIINMVTKSGGNRFSGLFDGYGSHKSLGWNNVPPSAAAANPDLASPAKITRYFDVTTQVGGPILQNRLFFFASAQRFLLDTDPTGPVTNRHEVAPRLNMKLTWQPNANDNFSALLQYDSYSMIGRAGVSPLIATDNLTNRMDSPEYIWMGQFRHLFTSKTFAEMKYSAWRSFFDLNPEVKAPAIFTDTGLVLQSQGWFYYADRARQQVNASVTHFADASGRHEMKFGAEFERSTTRDRYGYVGGVNFYESGGVPYYAYSYGYDISAHNVRQSVFAQDSWHATKRLTINAGVRGDMIQGYGDGNGSTVRAVGKVYSSSNWAPRLGAALDLTEDNRTVVRGSYGWYYEGAQTVLFNRAVAGVSDFITYAAGPDLTVGPVIGDRPAVIDRVANNVKHPRVDEATAGFERVLSGAMRLTVTGVWRENKNFVNSVLPDARWAPIVVTNALSNEPLTVYRWVNPTASNQNYIIQNVDGFRYLDPDGNVIGTAHPFRRYRALFVVVNKRSTNRWQAQASYVLSKATGNVDNTGSAQIASRQFETPNLALVNATGTLTNDRRHEFKLLGSYRIPVVDASVNAYVFAASGRNYAAFEQFSSSTLSTAAQSSRRPLLEMRGARRLPGEMSLDLRLEKEFRTIGGDRVGLYLDIKNVTNRGGILSVLTRAPSTAVVTPTGSVTLPFETPAAIQTPRQVLLGARWAF
jgi:hypothetical protein